jgi:hypothetical protein
MQADEWIAQDLEWQRAHYEREGRRPARLNAPPVRLFADAEQHRLAIAGRKVLCDQPEHPGERVLAPDDRYKNNVCKACTSLKQKAKRDAARPDPVVYATADAFLEANAHRRSATHPTIQGHCREPRPEEFADAAEFARAQQLAKDWCAEYRRQRMHLEAMAEAERARSRARHAAMVASEEGRERLRELNRGQDARRRDRLAAPPSDPGRGVCRTGAHEAPLADFFFDPVEDLGIVDYQGERSREIRRSFCVRHYAKALERDRRSKANAGVAVESRRAYVNRLLRRHNIPFDISDERMLELFAPGAHCYHCGASPETAEELTIDFYEAGDDRQATDDGVFTCCHNCKVARGSLTLGDFRAACGNVARWKDHGLETAHPIPYQTGPRTFCKGLAFPQLVARAEEKGMVVEFDRAHHDALRHRSRCYLCGVAAREATPLGVDRVDNGVGYTLANSRPCCTCCNMMKRTMTHEGFVALCRRVHARSAQAASSSSSA